VVRLVVIDVDALHGAFTHAKLLEPLEVIGGQQLLDASERHARLGQGLDLDEVDGVRRAATIKLRGAT
jgi:hypothetical protein